MDLTNKELKNSIVIKGARVNNLKNIDLIIPRDKLIIITGVSGSGKSSLAFDTLFAEGQRKYVESLSSYARQFLGRMEKPDVDYITGISPAIAIEQKVITKNPRSTVGTTTEIYDYIKLLFSRIGSTFSPISGNKVKKDTVTDVVDFLLKKEEGTKVIFTSPLIVHNKSEKIENVFNLLLSKGFTRLFYNNEIHFINDFNTKGVKISDVEILIDRLKIKNDEDTQFRLADSVQTAFMEGEGICNVYLIDSNEKYEFSDKFELDGIVFEQPTINFFSFNNPYGACKSCGGFGQVIGIDENKVFPNKNLSVYEEAIYPWRSEAMKKYLEPLVKNGIEFDFPIHRSIIELSEEQYQLLWTGNEYFTGLNDFFEMLESQTHKIQYRVLLSRYKGKTICRECKGTRLRKDTRYVKIDGHTLIDMLLLPISKLIIIFDNLKLTEYEEKVSKRILEEIKNRLSYINDVGLGYLTLNRLTSTLSGGEFQRIKLATSLGSALVGAMYILDEPSIGLHPRDSDRLIKILLNLKKMGNSVIVVEHEEKIMLSADQIIDIGPGAGIHGGQLIFQGNLNELDSKKESESLTIKYLKNDLQIDLKKNRRQWTQSIKLEGCCENNLKNLKTQFPIGVLTVVTGVSGSGKSTLIKKILYPALCRELDINFDYLGSYENISGDFKIIKQLEFVDQNPIGRSSRSNPITYVKGYDYIRQLFADEKQSKRNGYTSGHFSFNVTGGRCEVCQGEGFITIEMQFMADLNLICEECKGLRFKKQILEVKFKDKNIYEILNMTVEESLDFFKDNQQIINRLQPLYDVGLGYVKLGQSSSTLSGGEAQRVKLASFLGNATAKTPHTLFIFDEPTTGLHFHDIAKLLKSIEAIVTKGHTVIVIEHNVEIIKNADWIIDLGPDGGENGGQICFEGTPEAMTLLGDENHTAKYLKIKMK